MRRLFLFLGSLRWGGRLQMLVIAILLGWYAWFDYARNRSHVTIGIMLLAWTLGWIMKPLVIYYPRQTFSVWKIYGYAILLTFVLAHDQWWWKLEAAHYAREFIMWMDLSLGYWFVSEYRLFQERLMKEAVASSQNHDEEVEEIGDDAFV